VVNVTFLVCNRPKLTHQALASLGPTDDDVITVTVSEDRKCDSETQKVLSEWYQSNPKNKHLCGHTAEYGTGTLRNHVITASEKYFGRGDYLYLSDNDVFFYPAIFEKLVPIYEYAWTLGFKVLGAYNHPFHQPIGRYPVYAGGNQIISYIYEVQALALQSMLMKWEVFDKYGPFVDTPVGRVCMGEDIAFTNKIRADGFKIGVVNPPLVVNTGITNSFGEKIPGWEAVQKECPLGVYVE
jgi:GT2 family glycosyltransferase